MSNQRILPASPLFHRSEQQMQTYRVYHSHRENLMTDSSRLQSSTTKPVAFGHSESERDIGFLKNRTETAAALRGAH